MFRHWDSKQRPYGLRLPSFSFFKYFFFWGGGFFSRFSRVWCHIAVIFWWRFDLTTQTDWFDAGHFIKRRKVALLMSKPPPINNRWFYTYIAVLSASDYWLLRRRRQPALNELQMNSGQPESQFRRRDKVGWMEEDTEGGEGGGKEGREKNLKSWRWLHVWRLLTMAVILIERLSFGFCIPRSPTSLAVGYAQTWTRSSDGPKRKLFSECGWRSFGHFGFFFFFF